MEERKTKGKIVLTGFKLEPAEKAIVDNLIQHWKRRFEERVSYNELSIRMKKSQRGKAFLHEVQGVMRGDKTFSSTVEEYNLFAAIDEVCEKIMHEATHNQRRIRMRGDRNGKIKANQR